MFSATELTGYTLDTGRESDNGFEGLDLIRYPVAAVTDLAATMADSLAEVVTLGYYDSDATDTSTWLKNIDEYTNLGVSDFYEDNQELVNITSFVGGMLVPGMAMAKGIRAAQKSTSILPNMFKGLERAKQVNTAKAIESFKSVEDMSLEYKAAMKAVRSATLKQGIAENLVMEVGFMAMMNGHAYMDNDYGPADFAIGAAFGTVFAPLNWVIKKKEIMTELIDVQKLMKKDSARAIGISYTSETYGHTLTGYSMSYNAAQDMLVSNPASFNFNEIENVGKFKVRTTSELKGLITEMTDDTLKAKAAKDFKISEPEGVHKKVIESLDYPEADIFEAGTSTLLTRMAIKQPGVFTGVDRFSSYNIDDVIDDALIDTTYFSRSQGEAKALNSVVAVENISGSSWDVGALRRANASTEESFPWKGGSIQLDFINDRGRQAALIEVPNSKVLKDKDFKKWFALRLAHPSVGDTPVVIRSADGRLTKVSSGATKSRLKANAATVGSQVEGVRGVSEGKFVTPAMLDDAVPDTDFGLVIPYHGHKVLPGHNARIALPAAADPHVQVNSLSYTHTIKYDPLASNTQTIDGAFLEASYIAKNDKKRNFLNNTVIDVADLPKMHTALLQAKELDDVVIKTSAGELSVDEAIVEFIKQKAIQAEKIIKAGGMNEQAALYTNLGADQIELLHAAQWQVTPELLKNFGSWGKYIGDNPNVYHGAIPIRVLGKHRTFAQLEDMRAKSMLDMDTLRESSRGILREIVTSKQANDIGELYDNVTFSDSFKYVQDNIDTLLTTVETNSRLIQSADSALRSHKRVGEVVSYLGKTMLETVNKHIKGIVGQLEKPMRSLATSPTDMLQLEQLRRSVQAFVDDGARLVVEGDKIKIIGGDRNGEFLKYIDGPNSSDIVMTPKVLGFMKSYQGISDQLLNETNVLRRNANLPDMPNRGLWFPYEAVEDKFIGFKVNKNNPNDIFIITSDSAKGLEDRISQARKAGDAAAYDYVTRDQIGYWSDLLDTATLNPLRSADAAYKKSGIALHDPRPDAGGLDDLMDQIVAMKWRVSRMAIKQSGSEVFQKLDKATQLFDEATKSSKGKLGQLLGQKTPAAEIAYKTMMNTSLMAKSPVLQMVNDGTTAKINQALTWTRGAVDNLGLNKAATEEGYAELGRQAKAAGIPVPWQNFEDYLVARGQSRVSNMAEHRIAQVNGLSTLFNLRLLDFAHAAVTVLSTPVIMSGQMKHAGIPMKEFIQTAKWIGKQGPEYKQIIDEARNRGLVGSTVAETTELLNRLHTEKGKWGKTVRDLGEKLSIASDWSERATREFSFAMGYRVAKQRGITSKDLRMAYADNFVTRSMGNYVSRQRPVLFQGSMGSIIGLYQTFMVTMGQNIYRYVEAGDKKALAYLMGAQSGMFGFESLPFYHPFNRMLGEYMSDDNENISTETYAAMGKDAAEFALYGAPSYLFQTGLYTRAELQPRSVFTAQEGIGFNPASLNNIMQGFSFAGQTISSLASSIANDGSVGDWGHAIAQGVAAQSIWRPGARVSEMVMGRSYDGKGELVSGPEDVWTLPSTLSRIFASRPLKETVLRQAKFNAGYYNASDKASRQKVIRQVRRVASMGDSLGDSHEPLFDSYIAEGGSADGWRDIVKQSYMEANTPFAERIQAGVKRQEGWVELLEDYK